MLLWTNVCPLSWCFCATTKGNDSVGFTTHSLCPAFATPSARETREKNYIKFATGDMRVVVHIDCASERTNEHTQHPIHWMDMEHRVTENTQPNDGKRVSGASVWCSRIESECVWAQTTGHEWHRHVCCLLSAFGIHTTHMYIYVFFTVSHGIWHPPVIGDTNHLSCSYQMLWFELDRKGLEGRGKGVMNYARNDLYWFAAIVGTTAAVFIISIVFTLSLSLPLPSLSRSISLFISFANYPFPDARRWICDVVRECDFVVQSKNATRINGSIKLKIGRHAVN